MADEALTPLFDNPDEQRAYEEFCANQEMGPEPFDLDRPALVCRWRMAKKHVPMLNRHIRALSQRVVQGEPLTHNMLSWAKQHVEWSLAEGSYADPNGVLMLVIDVNGNAAMTVGGYEPLDATDASALAVRARNARAEQEETGVAPELLVRVSDGVLYLGACSQEHLCGSATLVEQLAQTRGVSCVRALGEESFDGFVEATGAFALISDEHGVVCADGQGGSDAELASSFARDVRKLFS